jgi:hypothetical protein
MPTEEEWDDARALEILNEDIQARNMVKRMDVMTTAYGNLIVRHHQAARAGDEPLRLRIYAALELFAELWPEEANAWEGLFGSPEH